MKTKMATTMSEVATWCCPCCFPALAKSLIFLMVHRVISWYHSSVHALGSACVRPPAGPDSHPTRGCADERPGSERPLRCCEPRAWGLPSCACVFWPAQDVGLTACVPPRALPGHGERMGCRLRVRPNLSQVAGRGRVGPLFVLC